MIRGDCRLLSQVCRGKRIERKSLREGMVSRGKKSLGRGESTGRMPVWKVLERGKAYNGGYRSRFRPTHLSVLTANDPRPLLGRDCAVCGLQAAPIERVSRARG